jgi:hypothetical protein
MAGTATGSALAGARAGERDLAVNRLERSDNIAHPQAGNNRLPVLAEEIRRSHDQARLAARTSLAHAIEAGEKLIEAKAHLPHGQWLPWLREHVSISERSAQVYIRLAAATRFKGTTQPFYVEVFGDRGAAS